MKTRPSADPGLEAVAKRAREIDPEPEHAFQVCATSLQLFDALDEVHGMGAGARRLLEAAALLHDIGHTISPFQHHKHARDLILEEDLPGFSDTECMMIACIARYHRKAHPHPKHKTYYELSESDQKTVTRLAALLRIGDGLDRSHAACTQSVRVERAASSICIYATQRRPNEVDLWGANRKRQLFKETFGLDVEILAEEE